MFQMQLVLSYSFSLTLSETKQDEIANSIEKGGEIVEIWNKETLK